MENLLLVEKPVAIEAAHISFEKRLAPIDNILRANIRDFFGLPVGYLWVVTMVSQKDSTVFVQIGFFDHMIEDWRVMTAEFQPENMVELTDAQIAQLVMSGLKREIDNEKKLLEEQEAAYTTAGITL